MILLAIFYNDGNHQPSGIVCKDEQEADEVIKGANYRGKVDRALVIDIDPISGVVGSRWKWPKDKKGA